MFTDIAHDLSSGKNRGVLLYFHKKVKIADEISDMKRQVVGNSAMASEKRFLEAATQRRCSLKKAVCKSSQNSRENSSSGVSF